MTNTRTLLPTIAIAGVCLLLGSTGGAVAGGLITGQDIKNNSITGKDVKDGSLETGDLSAASVSALHGANGAAGAPGAPGTNGVSGYEFVDITKNVPANTPTDEHVACPTGKKILGASGYWVSSNAAVQVVIFEDGSGATIYTTGIPTADQLTAQAVCATVASARPAARGTGKSAR
jgi:hypothetical protein